MKVKTLLNQKLRRALGVLSVLAWTACTSFPPTVPIEMPFGLGKGGESVEFDFRVKEMYGYVVNLEIFFNGDAPGEWKKLRSQLGEGIHADGSIGQVGVPVTLRVRVQSIEIQGPPVDFDQTTDKIGFVVADKNFATKRVLKINNQKLQPGTYHIRVDNLHPVPEFADRIVRISINHAEQGK